MNADTVSQLVTVLEKTTSGDQNELKQAQQFLEQAAQSNLPQLIRLVYSCVSPPILAPSLLNYLVTLQDPL